MPSFSTLADLDRALAAAWADLASLLAGLSAADLLAEDATGWTIKDHLTHLVAWENSVAALFQGRQRPRRAWRRRRFLCRGVVR